MSINREEDCRSKVLDALNSRYSCLYDPQSDASTSFERPELFNKVRRCLSPLRVYGNRDVDEIPHSPLPNCFSKLLDDQNIIDSQIIKEKVTAALSGLRFREPRVLVQFWSPVTLRKRCLLTTLDQPFGLGAVDEGLYLYRLGSEQRMFVVDGEHREDIGPPGRVYREKMPEWSLDINMLSTRQNVKDWAASYNIHGYINLPVFEPDSGCCVGVLELITSSDYVDYAFEVREVSRALKEEKLKSSNVFEDLILNVGDERKQHEFDEILCALKTICDVQEIPLAQTWGLSGYSSVVANSGNLERTCSSYNRKCIGKVCMSTYGLPYYARNLRMWGFVEACTQQHLDKSKGIVGRSLWSRGSCYCEDVTKLGEDEYPLGYYAHVNGITGCLAVYLESIERDVEYVIEFVLPPHKANGEDLQSLVKTVKHVIEKASSVKLGIMSSLQVIGGEPFDWNLEPPPSPITLLDDKGEVPPNPGNQQPLVDNELTEVTVLKDQSVVAANVEHIEHDYLENEPSVFSAAGTSQSVVPCLEVEFEDSDINKGKTRTNNNQNSSNKPGRKRKGTDGSISLEDISKHYGKTMDEAAVILHVSRSTLKRICRSLGVFRWPYKNGPDKSDSLIKATNIHASEGVLTSVFEGSDGPLSTTDVTHNAATLTEHGKYSSTPVLLQQVQTIRPDELAQLETTFRNSVEQLTIKATYKENTVSFSFIVSDGFVKLEELITSKFQLKLGSFSLKYEDKDGDMILIACDSDLMGSVDDFKLSDGQTVVKLLVWPLDDFKLTSVFEGSDGPLSTTNVTHNAATLTEHGKYSSTPVLHQQVQTIRPDELAQLETTFRNSVEQFTIKATYKENTVSFSFIVSDGFVKLEELITSKFQLKLGSFSLKYEDKDGDMILIACDSDLMGSVDDFKLSDGQTVVKLLVWPLDDFKLTSVFEGSDGPLSTTNVTHNAATLTEHGKYSSTPVLHQQVQTIRPDELAQLETTFRNSVEQFTIKATYKENTVSFSFIVSDGFVKLEELITSKFQLKLGSFSLKYEDKDGDMILIACDSDLMGSVDDFKLSDGQTVVKLLVWPLDDFKLTSVFEGSDGPLSTTNVTHNAATLTEHGKYSSTPVLHQQVQTIRPDELAQLETTFRNSVEQLTIKATYKENTVSFSFIVSDGFVKLEELITSKFQLKLGSFSLKYEDKDGDMILIACDSDLMGSVDDFKLSDGQTVIKLLVWPLVDKSPDA